MGKITRRTEIHVNRILQELNVLHDILVQTYDDFDLDWHLLQVENAKNCLMNILGSGDYSENS